MIKFRAWDKVAKVMVYHIEQTYDGLGYFQENEDIEDYVSNISFECFSDWLENDQFVIMQSTGLFDKNGVEIFEGDMVMDDSGKINKIVFTEYEDTDYYGQTHMGFISENNDYVDQFITLPSLIKKGIKIIGNIYELESVEE